MHISHKRVLRHWIQWGPYLKSPCRSLSYGLCSYSVSSNTQRHLFNIMPRLSPFHATVYPFSSPEVFFYFFIAAANVAARKGTKIAL